MSEETDPTKLMLAAGSSGGKYGFMSIKLSDKGAKDYAKAMDSIETTSKMGGWQMMMMMAQKFMDIAGLYSLMEAIADLFAKMISAETADTLSEIYDAFFDEEATSQMKEVAQVLGTVFSTVWNGIMILKKAGEDFEAMCDHFDNVTQPAIQEAFGQMCDDAWEAAVKTGENIVGGIYEAMEEGMHNIKDFIEDWLEDNF